MKQYWSINLKRRAPIAPPDQFRAARDLLKRLRRELADAAIGLPLAVCR